MKKTTVLNLIGLLAFASGCHTPKHSNVLIFATNTKVAFDISYDPKIQQPNITLGFTRQEGVWMPLLANYGPDGLEPGPLTITDNTKKPAEVSKIEPQTLYQGKDGKNNRDTYSVLATFKGSGAAKASGTNGSEMSGSIAQFFATGLAARELARSGGAALVSTKASSPQQDYSKYVEGIYQADAATKTLRNWLIDAQGNYVPANKAALTTWMTANNLSGLDIAPFLNLKQFAQDRLNASHALIK